MSRWAACIATLVLVVLAPALGAQSMDQSMKQAMADYSAWMEKLAEFTRGIEFDESDLTTMIERYPEMESLELMTGDEDDTDPQNFDENMRQVLSDPEYRDWANRNDLDPEEWLKTVSRISSVFMVVTTEVRRPEAEKQQQQYEAMVEQQCAQVDPETCRAMRDGLAASRAMSDAIAEAQTKLPPPTANERRLIQQYSDDLDALMMSYDESAAGEDSWDEDDDSYDEDE